MPLSEHEQRLFDQIEQSLAKDPKFASAVRATDPRFHARRRIIIAAVLLAGRLRHTDLSGVASKNIPLGVGGFVVMLVAAAVRRCSPCGGAAIRSCASVGGTARRTGRGQRRSSMIDRLEERWRQPSRGRTLARTLADRSNGRPTCGSTASASRFVRSGSSSAPESSVEISRLTQRRRRTRTRPRALHRPRRARVTPVGRR